MRMLYQTKEVPVFFKIHFNFHTWCHIWVSYGPKWQGNKTLQNGETRKLGQILFVKQ